MHKAQNHFTLGDSLEHADTKNTYCTIYIKDTDISRQFESFVQSDTRNKKETREGESTLHGIFICQASLLHNVLLFSLLPVLICSSR